MHARFVRHSEFMRHSGLQFGGRPIKSRTHEHAGLSPFTWQKALGPQGEGSHGSFGGKRSLGSESEKKYYRTNGDSLKYLYIK